MVRRDYSEEEDYYSQDFERPGMVSIWLGFNRPSTNADVDVLQDLCAVGYYDLDAQESNHFEFQEVALEALLTPISYSTSFLASVLAQARSRGISSARWVQVQFDFAYDPAKVRRTIAPDPVFLGAFPYTKDES